MIASPGFGPMAVLVQDHPGIPLEDFAKACQAESIEAVSSRDFP